MNYSVLVFGTRDAEVPGAHTLKALKWSSAGPIYNNACSDHEPLLSGESQASTLHPSGDIG
jgi:hypothetical protein